MSTTFNLIATCLQRLAALRYATDSTARGALSHIHLAVSGDGARFTATNGSLLAMLSYSVGEFDGDPAEVVLDGALFAAACTTLLRADHALTLRVIIDREENEVRFIRGMAVAVVRLVEVTYPVVTGFLERYRGMTMVPAIATYAPSLLTAASRIVGTRRTTLILSSPTADGDLARCWGIQRDTDDAAVSCSSIARLLTQPGLWSDNTLLLLLMPITRDGTSTADVTQFIAPTIVAEMASSAA